MTVWLDRLLAAGLIVTVIVLTLTALPSLGGSALHGTTLMTHMAASGAMVFLLPAYAIVGLIRMSVDPNSGPTRAIGFWGLVASGLVTIATVFACMLPIASTDQMHTLILWHGVAGYAMTVAAIVWMAGVLGKRSTGSGQQEAVEPVSV